MAIIEVRIYLQTLLMTIVLLLMPMKSAMALPIVPDADLHCLSNMIYYEARSEGYKGMLAVAYVAVNRTKHPELYGRGVCGVVYKPKQFDGMKYYSPIKGDKTAWETAKKIASLSLLRRVKDPSKGSLYFHTTSIKPKWSYTKIKTIILGNHIFYR